MTHQVMRDGDGFALVDHAGRRATTPMGRPLRSHYPELLERVASAIDQHGANPMAAPLSAYGLMCSYLDFADSTSTELIEAILGDLAHDRLLNLPDTSAHSMMVRCCGSDPVLAECRITPGFGPPAAGIIEATRARLQSMTRRQIMTVVMCAGNLGSPSVGLACVLGTSRWAEWSQCVCPLLMLGERSAIRSAAAHTSHLGYTIEYCEKVCAAVPLEKHPIPLDGRCAIRRALETAAFFAAFPDEGQGS